VGWFVPVLSLWWPLQDVRQLAPPGDRAIRHSSWWWAFHLASLPAAIVGMLCLLLGPPTVQVVGLAIVAAVPAIAAILERRIVADVLVAHQRLADQNPAPGTHRLT
jgi:hypothetical protein